MRYAQILSRYNGTLKANGEYWMRCPFHDERTPSMSVNTSSGFYYCFGCHAHGGLVDLLSKLDGIGRDQAARMVSSLGPITKADRQAAPKKQYLKEQLLERFFPVQSTPYLDYLRKRKIPESIAHAFDLRQGNAMAAQWNNRVIYAIRDVRGYLASIEGRTIAESNIRYFKQPGSLASIGLFGIERIEKKLPYLYVVEGVFDALSLAAVGRPAVALCSSSLSREQIQQLRKVTDFPIVVLDGYKPTAKKEREAVAAKIRMDLTSEFGGDRVHVHSLALADRDINELHVAGQLRRYLSQRFGKIEKWAKENAQPKARRRSTKAS